MGEHGARCTGSGSPGRTSQTPRQSRGRLRLPSRCAPSAGETRGRAGDRLRQERRGGPHRCTGEGTERIASRRDRPEHSHGPSPAIRPRHQRLSASQQGKAATTTPRPQSKLRTSAITHASALCTARCPNDLPLEGSASPLRKVAWEPQRGESREHYEAWRSPPYAQRNATDETAAQAAVSGRFEPPTHGWNPMHESRLSGLCPPFWSRSILVLGKRRRTGGVPLAWEA